MENVTSDIKPKRKRGRPPGTKNSKKSCLDRALTSYPPDTSNVVHDTSESIRVPDNVNTVATSDILYIPAVPPITGKGDETAVQSFATTTLNPNIEAGNSAFAGADQSSSCGMQNVHQSTPIERGNTLQMQTTPETVLQSQEDQSQLIIPDQISPQLIYLPESDVTNIFYFISLLRNLTSDEPRLYLSFLELMEQFLKEEIDSSALSLQISTLFAAYPILLTWFNTYGSKVQANNSADQGENSGTNDSIIFLSPAANIAENSEVSECPERMLQSPVPISQQQNGMSMSVGADPTVSVPAKDTEINIPQQNGGRSSIINNLKPNDVYEAKNFNDMAWLALSFHESLKIMLDEEPQKYKMIRNTLSELHESGKDVVSSMDSKCSSEDSTRRKRALDKIYELLGDKPKLYELCKAFFTSDKNFLGLPSCTPGPGTSLDLTTNNVAGELGMKEQPKTSKESVQSQPELSAYSIEPISENESHATLKTNTSEQVVLPTNLTISQGISDVAVPPAVQIEQETSSVNGNLENNELFAQDEVELRRLLRAHFDEEKWIMELVNALSPILMKISSLRNYILNNLRASLLRRDEMPSSELARSPIPLQSGSRDDADVGAGSSETYKVNIDTLPKCSGRTELCNEVLNDTLYSTSARSKFRLNARSEEDKRLDDYEDARYEVDMMLHRNASAIQVFEDLQLQMSKMTPEELETFRLDDNLGGLTVLHRKAVELYFGEFVINQLKRYPSVYLPSVILMLKIQDKDLIELKARWNSIISADLKRFTDRCNHKKKIQGFIRHTPERQRRITHN